MSTISGLGVFWACSLASAYAAGTVGGQSIATVQSKFIAFNRHSVAEIEGIYSDRAMLNSPDYHELMGNKPIADTYRKLFEAIPDATDEVELLEAAGSHVYAQFILHGHWGGMQDKPINVRIIAVYKVEGDRIVDDATYYDRKSP
jgi:SnoaL-like polyketide cyclase